MSRQVVHLVSRCPQMGVLSRSAKVTGSQEWALSFCIAVDTALRNSATTSDRVPGVSRPFDARIFRHCEFLHVWSFLSSEPIDPSQPCVRLFWRKSHRS